jgi:hypothetical protein
MVQWNSAGPAFNWLLIGDGNERRRRIGIMVLDFVAKAAGKARAREESEGLTWSL